MAKCIYDMHSKMGVLPLQPRQGKTTLEQVSDDYTPMLSVLSVKVTIGVCFFSYMR